MQQWHTADKNKNPMKAHLQTLSDNVKQKQFKAIVDNYQQLSEYDRCDQLRYLFNSGQRSEKSFDFFQKIAAKLIEVNGLEANFICFIDNADALTFFTPGVKESEAFANTDHTERNLLHYLLSNPEQLPPFNYIRSLCLFESNEDLSQSLAQTDALGLTPIQLYLSQHSDLSPLPEHEFSALFALIEIEKRQLAQVEAQAQNNSEDVSELLFSAVQKLYRQQELAPSKDDHRLIVMASYLQLATEQVFDKVF